MPERVNLRGLIPGGGDPLAVGAGLQVRLVGRGTVWRDRLELADSEVGARKARLLLRLLACRAGAVSSTDELAECVWGPAQPHAPAENLATLVSRLRASLGPAVITGDRTGWSLGPAVSVDVVLAKSLVDSARMHATGGEPALALSAADAAAALLGAGGVLIGDGDASWAEEPRDRVERLRQGARMLAADAALTVGDARRAVVLAAAALSADPYDEQAARLLMQAYRRTGQGARGVAEYEVLRRRLVDELGVDPDPTTQALYLELLGDPVTGLGAPYVAPRRPPELPTTWQRRAPTGLATGRLAGRETELALLAERWSAAAAGSASVVLLTGEAGIGKTRLAVEVAALAAASGGVVLQARCYQAERSLFLQPLADAIRAQVVELDPRVLRSMVDEGAASLALLVPEVTTVTGVAPQVVANPEAERRMVYEAVLGFLRRLGQTRPVLLLLDDLHEAGLATVEIVHLLSRRLGGARVLVVGTLRVDDGASTQEALAGVASTVLLGTLTDGAVRELATAAGQAEHAERLAASTGGHPLFLVELLQSLSAGQEGVPASLAELVADRVRRAGPQAHQLVQAASVLGTAFGPGPLAGLLGRDELDVARECERLAARHLFVRSGPGYEFANDLTREIIYSDTPRPVRDVLHSRAAVALQARPEVAARHASACERWDLATTAWLAAGQDAVGRYAADDGIRMLSLAVESATRCGGEQALWRAHLERGRACTSRGRFAEALEDFRAALDIAVRNGWAQHELDARRELAGDVLVGLGRPIAECHAQLDAALVVARALGDGAHEADLLSRSAIVCGNRLLFDRALADGRRGVQIARDTGDPAILGRALDGLKHCYAYTGQLAALTQTLSEAEPLLSSANDVFRLQWCGFERALVPLGEGRWDEMTTLVQAALELNRSSGWTAFESWFLSHLGWAARLADRPDEALDLGRRAVRLHQQGTHPWWSATAYAMLAATLLAVGGDIERAEAIELLGSGLDAADRSGVEGFRLRCLALLAEASGSARARAQADLMFARIQAPREIAWMHGIDAYLALARSWLAGGAPERAADLLAPVAAAARACGWSALFTASGGPDLLTAAGTAGPRSAGRPLGGPEGSRSSG